MDRQPGTSVGAPFIQIAPMEGVLDWILREMLCAVGGVDRAVTEFVRVTDRLLPDHVFIKYCPELLIGGRTSPGTPTFVQLLGGKPEWLAENAASVARLGALGVDLNFGCPAKTVNRHDGGATLLKDPQRVYECVKAVRQSTPDHIPVTAKVRLGFEHKDYHREIARASAEGGAASLVVHARTKLEMYQPPAHWEYICWMKDSVSIPVIANGEIWNIEDYQSCKLASGVRDVALGRGLVANPLLAREIKSEELNFSPRDFLITFLSRSAEVRNEDYAVARMKQILRYWSFKNPVYKNLFDRVKLEKDYVAVMNLITQEESAWQELKFIPGQFAPTVFVPKIY